MQTGMDMLAAAMRHHHAGEAAEAERLYRFVLAQEPDQPQALHLCGMLMLKQGDAEGAATLLARAAEVRPGDPAPLVALGSALMTLGRNPAATRAFRAVLVFAPGHAVARVGLAASLLSDGQPAAALAEADAVHGHAPGSGLAEAQFIRGTALAQLGRASEAEAALRAAIAVDPAHAKAHLNLGNVLVDLDRPAAAERLYRAAIRLDPALAEAHASLGHVLSGLDRTEEAVSACAEAIRLRPDFAQAHWNQGIALLRAGDFTRGFEKYEWRKRHATFAAAFADPPGPAWEGQPLAGRTLLVLAEQGLGDTIQFARYIPALAAHGARVVLACARPLLRLLRTLPGIAEVVEHGERLPPYDFRVDQMSLPRLFATQPTDIPLPGGYLVPDPALAAAWQAAMPAAGAARRVGLVWAGNPLHSNDARRSIPLGLLAPVLATPGVRFVGLQAGPRAAEAAGHPALHDLSGRLADFADTAAAIAALDLVITVDTSVAHLAGALGAPVWVLLPAAADWRWMMRREDSPWYASMRLFRQQRAGDWGETVGRVAEALAENEPMNGPRTAELQMIS